MSYYVLCEDDFITYYIGEKAVQVGSFRLKEIFQAELEGRLIIVPGPPEELARMVEEGV